MSKNNTVDNKLEDMGFEFTRINVVYYTNKYEPELKNNVNNKATKQFLMIHFLFDIKLQGFIKHIQLHKLTLSY